MRRPTPDGALAHRLATLTKRELSVTRLIAHGLTNAEIASRLHLGVGTVKTHITNVLAKLALRNRTQIVVAAYEGGLVEPGHDPLAGV